MKPSDSQVEPIDGEPFRFFVRSRTNSNEKYLVDVEDGFCGCAHHQYRVLPALEKGEPVQLCWHLQRARDFLLDAFIQVWKEENEKGQPCRTQNQKPRP